MTTRLCGETDRRGPRGAGAAWRALGPWLIGIPLLCALAGAAVLVRVPILSAGPLARSRAVVAWIGDEIVPPLRVIGAPEGAVLVIDRPLSTPASIWANLPADAVAMRALRTALRDARPVPQPPPVCDQTFGPGALEVLRTRGPALWISPFCGRNSRSLVSVQAGGRFLGAFSAPGSWTQVGGTRGRRAPNHT